MERRPAQGNDASEIVSWFSSAAEATLWGGSQVPWPLTAQWLAQEIDKGGTWVWCDGGARPRGVFTLTLLEGDSAHLARFALAPDLRGQGLARACVEGVKALARSLGAKRLALGVYGSNRVALHLYKSMGFVLAGERVAAEDASGVSFRMMLDL